MCMQPHTYARTHGTYTCTHQTTGQSLWRWPGKVPTCRWGSLHSIQSTISTAAVQGQLTHQPRHSMLAQSCRWLQAQDSGVVPAPTEPGAGPHAAAPRRPG